MLRSIALKNFKAFERLEELELRPLTVFCGPNAVGKSSVIQALLMMRQTIDEGMPPGTPSYRLVTDGADVSLGDYVDVVFGRDLRRSIGIELSVPVPGDFELRSIVVEKGFWKEPVVLTLLLEYWIWDEVVRAWAPDTWDALSAHNAVPTLQHLRLCAKGVNGQELVAVDARYVAPDVIDVTLTFGETMKHADRYLRAIGAAISLRGLMLGGEIMMTTPKGDAEGQSGQYFDTSDPRTKHPAVTLQDWDDDCGAPELVGLVSRMLDEVSSRLTVRYVGPAREVPQRYYDMVKQSLRVGASRGGRDWKADLTSGVARVRKPQDDPNTYRGEMWIMPDGLPGLQTRPLFGDSLDETINAWLDDLGLPKVHPVLEGRDFRVMVSSPYAKGCSVSVADTGYGVSQVLPVLLAGAASDDEIVVLDQPELHLHPKLQTGMADFAIAVSETRQVLVETHSDHFVNRIVRRVVEGKISADDVAVYFFTPTADGPHVEMVEVDPTFGIKNWPLGFFDDFANDQAEIIRASIKRRKQGDE